MAHGENSTSPPAGRVARTYPVSAPYEGEFTSKHRPFSPISHHFNRDPEVIALRREFGDWIALAWQELLHEADRNEGVVVGTLDEIAEKMAPVSLQKYLGRAANAARMALERMSKLGWFVQRSSSIEIAKFWEYHRKRDANWHAPNLPNLTFKDKDKKKSKIKSRYPDGFMLSPELENWTLSQNVGDPHRHLEAFRDYHVSKGNSFIAWDLAFRTWIRNAVRFGNNGAKQVDGELSNQTQRILRRGI